MPKGGETYRFVRHAWVTFTGGDHNALVDGDIAVVQRVGRHIVDLLVYRLGRVETFADAWFDRYRCWEIVDD